MRSLGTGTGAFGSLVLELELAPAMGAETRVDLLLVALWLLKGSMGPRLVRVGCWLRKRLISRIVNRPRLSKSAPTRAAIGPKCWSKICSQSLIFCGECAVDDMVQDLPSLDRRRRSRSHCSVRELSMSQWVDLYVCARQDQSAMATQPNQGLQVMRRSR